MPLQYSYPSELAGFWLRRSVLLDDLWEKAGIDQEIVRFTVAGAHRGQVQHQKDYINVNCEDKRGGGLDEKYASTQKASITMNRLIM